MPFRERTTNQLGFGARRTGGAAGLRANSYLLAVDVFFAVIGGADLPLTVLEPDNLSGNPALYSSYGTQGVFYTHSSGIKIDGYYLNPIVGTNKPCDPPTPGLP
jgi:hypothetical protein